MNGLEIAIKGIPANKHPLLVTIVRRDEGSPFPGDYQACHLFAYQGKQQVHEALRAALNEYLDDELQTNLLADDIDWFDMMAEREDYGEVFAKHGLTEVRIPMGMTSLIFNNNAKIVDCIEEDE